MGDAEYMAAFRYNLAYLTRWLRPTDALLLQIQNFPNYMYFQQVSWGVLLLGRGIRTIFSQLVTVSQILSGIQWSYAA